MRDNAIDIHSYAFSEAACQEIFLGRLILRHLARFHKMFEVFISAIKT